MVERYALNDLQQTVLDTLAEYGPFQPIDVDELIERVSGVPGMDDVNGNHMGPCLAALKRRELVSQPRKGGPCSITSDGLGYVDGFGEALPEDSPDAEPDPQSAPADELTPEGRDEPVRIPQKLAPATCSCGALLSADEFKFYHSQCEACVRREHEAMDPAAGDDLAEALIKGIEPGRSEYVDDHASDPAAPSVTPLSVAIHPPGTNHLHERAIFLSIDDEGAGPYLSLSGAVSSTLEIDDVATLQAVCREGARLLSQAQAQEAACQDS